MRSTKSKKHKKILNQTLSLLFAFAILFSGLNTYAIAENELSADMSNEAEDNVSYFQEKYPGQEEFDPLDTTPLTYSEVPTPGEQMYEGEWYYTGKSVDECRAEYEKVANAIIAKINPAWSDFRKLAYIHDFICLNAEYDRYQYDFMQYAEYDESKGCLVYKYENADGEFNYIYDNPISCSAYGNLVLHKSVCEGYARAFKDLANRAGIETYYVSGKAENEDGIVGHAWNASKLNGKYYFIDCTWDDGMGARHTYFLKSDSYMLANKHSDFSVRAGIGLDSYNDTTYDDAPFTKCNVAINFMGDSDRYCYYSGSDDCVYVANSYSIEKTLPTIYCREIKADDHMRRTYNNFYIRGDKCVTFGGDKYGEKYIFGGIIGNDSVDMSIILSEAPEGIYYYGTDGLKGTTLTVLWQENGEEFQFHGDFDAWIEAGDKAARGKETIDLSDFLEPDPFDLSLDGDGGSSISGENGESPEVIEGLNLAWNTVGGKSYWYENGIKQGTYNDAQGVFGDDGTNRGREIFDPATNAWYWLDSCFNGAKAVNKEVWMPYIFQGEKDWSEEQILDAAALSGDMAAQVADAIRSNGDSSQGKWGKWVRYDSNGAMIKGWYTVQGADASIYPSQTGNTYYYDPITGLMAKGWTTISGATYYFDETTGVLQK